MTEATSMTPTPQPAQRKPAKRRRKSPRRQAAPAAAAKPDTNEFAGMTETKCPTGCMRDGVCLISTVNVCKHPNMASDSGCGPITMANRERAKKFLKRQKIEAS